jgi:transposase
MTAAPVNEVDMTLLKASLKDFNTIVKLVGLIIVGAILNLDAGFDTKDNRKSIWNNKMIPNIKENPRNRQSIKRGRKRFFDEDIYKLRFTVERSFAWEDKFKRLLIRFERFHQRHMAFHLIAFTFINLREFCGS